MPRIRVSWFPFLLAVMVLLASTALGAWFPFEAQAQEGRDEPSEAAGDATSEEGEAASEAPSDDEPRLRPPTVERPSLDVEAASKPASGNGDPGEDSDLMKGLEPPEAASATWTAAQTALSLDGYFRFRFNVFENLALGRVPLRAGQSDLPFSRFIPIDRSAVPAGGCGDAATTDPVAGACSASSSGVNFASMRLRLEPTLTVSDDVRIHTTFDVFDNLVLGSTPTSGAYLPPGADGSATFFRPTRGSTDTFALGQEPPTALRNGLRDSIVVRRAWAEISNRDLGQLSFGRMGAHWGLGIVHNAGEGLDQDFSTDVDRVMIMTRLFGFTWLAAHDFAGTGFVFDDASSLSAVPFDLSQRDDIDQWVFGVARRMEPTQQEERLRAGGWVLNAGGYFLYRRQLLTTAALTNPFDSQNQSVSLVRRDANIFTPDVWAQFLWGDLRVELEAAVVAGSVGNLEDTFYGGRRYTLLQFGGAFEAEYRLLDRKLALRLYAGLASGDSDVDGLSASEGVLRQQTLNNRITTFQFHPGYRVDLILWRTLMERVAGAWYVRPGVGYDVIKKDDGMLLGGRLDVIYSRAMKEVQTYGSSYNLGVEGNATVYFRSADGPGPTDGFFAQIQYGLLVPLKGLDYPSYRGLRPDGAPAELSLAHTFRVLAAVEF